MKFKIGDIVQRGCVQYKIIGVEGDDYVAIDTVKLEHGLKSPFDITKISMYDDECELIKAAEYNVQPIEPKFKVGDKIRFKEVDVWGVMTIASIYKGCYMFEDNNTPLTISYVDENFELVGKSKPKFKVGDKIRFKDKNDIQHTITGVNDQYYYVDNDKYAPICIDYEDKYNQWELVEQPKFKVGDRVRRKVVDPHNPATKYIYTVIEIEDDIYHKYCLDHNDHESWVPISEQNNLELVEEPKPKFKVGDKVKNIWNENVYTVTSVTDTGYMLDDRYLPFGDETKWMLANEPETREPKSRPKLGVDLDEIPFIDTIWKDTLAKLVGDITERNTAAFVWQIDETLKFMDCGAYDEMACRGMRLFAKELKKRLGYES